MFNKLLSNLPFNPSLIGQVSFYAKRLHKESSIRRLGLVFIIAAMLVQVFVLVAPPQSTLARSGNDLIEGGFSSREEAVFHCQNNTGSFGAITNHFNISCDNIANAQTITISSTDYNNQLYSMGRIAYGKVGETPVAIDGSTFWLRYLWSWDSWGTTSTYTALQGTSRDGRTFLILYDCGNLVFIGLPPSPTPKCEWDSALLNTDSRCFQPCPINGKQNIPKTSSQCFEPCPVAKKSNISASDPECFEPCPVKGKESISKNSSSCFEPCPYNNAIAKDSPSCKPCEDSQTREDKTACLELSKTVRNNTQNISSANGTTAKPGDSLAYVLSVKNKGKAQIDGFIVQENISDVLDYADIVDLKGGLKDSKNIVSWPAVSIKAEQSIQKEFTVKIKNPLPQTPVSSSDPGHFDLTMTNVYGNAVNVKLPPSVVKSTEIITRSLPDTGPGVTLFAGFGLTAIFAYFFARSKLLARELDIVRHEHTASGGI